MFKTIEDGLKHTLELVFDRCKKNELFLLHYRCSTHIETDINCFAEDLHCKLLMFSILQIEHSNNFKTTLHEI